MFLPPKEQSYLDVEIDRAYRELANHEVGSEEYEKALDVVTQLHKLKSEDRNSKVSKDTMLTVGANLLGVLLIISTEREHVITTKALGMLQRTKN
jgi:hypothetical protein